MEVQLGCRRFRTKEVGHWSTQGTGAPSELGLIKEDPRGRDSRGTLAMQLVCRRSRSRGEKRKEVGQEECSAGEAGVGAVRRALAPIPEFHSQFGSTVSRRRRSGRSARK